MKSVINWKVFLILWIACVLSVLAILPYSLSLQAAALQDLPTPIPFPLIVAIQVIQNAVLFAVLIFGGLFFAGRVGLGAPILDAFTRGKPVARRLHAILPLSIVLGIVFTLLVLGLEFLIFQPAMLRELGQAAEPLFLQRQPQAWKGLLASFYGGIAEEVLLRLFLMSLLVWLGSFLGRTSAGRPASAVSWGAIVLAAVLFGLGHLPVTAAIVPLTPLVVTRAVVLNGVLGIALGWLYWKHGLESAMIAHFSADIVLHVLLAL